MLALEVKNLSKIYKNKTQALRNVSLNVSQGDFFALLGPNGAGKSTLISILTSLVSKTAGQVTIYGHNIDTDFAAAKSCIGVVPQEFNFSIFETVQDILIQQAGYYGIPYKTALGRSEHYLKQLGLWEKRHAISRSLSGGMKRRLMIARGLMHEPRMLILDEPTAGVDIEIRRSMWQFLRELNQQGITIILTTHYLEEAENLCHSIAIIDHGGIIAFAKMADFLQKLEKERFILYLKEEYINLPQVEGFTIWSLDPKTIEVEVPKDLGISLLFEQLSQQNIQVISLRNKSNRLEELFLDLTQYDAD